jgi:hypothetical protein
MDIKDMVRTGFLLRKKATYLLFAVGAQSFEEECTREPKNMQG